MGTGLATTSSPFVKNPNATDNSVLLPKEATPRSWLVGGLLAEEGAVERRELFISDFMQIAEDANCYVLAYAVLKALLPSLHRDDISTVRRVYPRSESAPDGSNLAPHEEGIEFSFPSLIVRLTSIDLVRRLMNAKRSFNYLNTGDIDHSLLSPDLASTLPYSKIFVNEVLSPSAYANYLPLKDAAKKNGFKFV